MARRGPAKVKWWKHQHNSFIISVMIVSAFCRSAIFLFQLSLHDFFHYELLNLAGDGGGELGDKCDVFGNLNSALKSSIRRFVITEKAPTRAFS